MAEWTTLRAEREEARAIARRLARVLADWNFDARATVLRDFETLPWAKEPA